MTPPTKPPEFVCPEGFQVCMSGNREYLAAELCGHLDDGEYFLIRRKHVDPPAAKATTEINIMLQQTEFKNHVCRVCFEPAIVLCAYCKDHEPGYPARRVEPDDKATDNDWKLQVVSDIEKLIGQRCELSDATRKLQQQIDSLNREVGAWDRVSRINTSQIEVLQTQVRALESKPPQPSEGNAVEKAIKATIAAFAAFDAGNMNLDELQDCIIGRIRKVEPAK